MSYFIYWFPDNTVLCNFACVGRLDLLQKILRGRGRWTGAIADEALRSATIYPDLRNVESDGWLGDPIHIDDPAMVNAIDRTRRAVFGGTTMEPLKHLGEATTCYLIQNEEEFASSYWITDDRAAADYARRKGITTRDTYDLMSEGVADGEISQRDGYDLLVQMRDLGRKVRVPGHVADL